jgi:hypothetical protein
MKIIGKCPKCHKNSLMEVNEIEVAGISQCRRHVINRFHVGVKCPLCNYHNCKVAVK